jgi:hypothetical protein
MKNFEDWWTFGSGDHTAGACHACVVLTHYLSERQISVLRDSGVPTLCQVGRVVRLPWMNAARTAKLIICREAN